MKALFVEMPAFIRHRSDYLDDEGLRALQNALMENPEAKEKKALKDMLKRELEARQ